MDEIEPKTPRDFSHRGIVKRGDKFYVRYKDGDGIRKQRKVDGARSYKDAEDFLSAIRVRIRNGKVGINEPTAEDKAQQALTLAQLVDRFNVEYRPPKLKDIVEYRKQTKSVMGVRVLPTLGKRPAMSITSGDMETLRDSLIDAKYTGASVAWTLARLSKVYEWAIAKGIIGGKNPARGVDRPDRDRTFDYLSAPEVGGLLRWLEGNASLFVDRGMPQVFPMIATAIYAGPRKGELFGLRWIDLHFDRSQITIARSYAGKTKSGKVRHVPMHPALARILRLWRDSKDRPADVDGLVFPMFDEDAKAWRMGVRRDMLDLVDWLKLAGCRAPRRPWHALRHTFASHFMMSGGSILTLSKLLGHASLEMVMIYAHLAPDFMAGEVARIVFPVSPATVTGMDEHRRLAEVGDAVDTDIHATAVSV